MLRSILTLLLFCPAFYAMTQSTNEELVKELDVFIESQMQQQSIPGLSACIVKGDKVVWKAAYGMANFANNTPVEIGTEFTLASISKLFTATACAQLWEKGELDLDADINDYLPIKVVNPNFPNTPMTTRQLLQHKSSLHDSESDLQLWDELGDPIYDLPTFCAAYFVEGGNLYVASNFGDTAPGLASYWYSNAGFTLLGYIVESVSGMPFNEYCEKNILEPLQMNSAGWFYADVDTDGMAMPYNLMGEAYGFYSVPEYPAAMLKANVSELANFLIAYTQKGKFEGQTLVNASTFASIVPDNRQNGFAWWGKDTWWGDPDGNFWSHGGYMNGVRTQLNYYPDDSTGLIILTNGEGNYLPIQNQLEAYIPRFHTDGTTASQELEAPDDIRIFPNPLTQQDHLILDRSELSSTEIQIQLQDIEGHTLYSVQTNASKVSIPLANYPKGLYLLQLISEDQIQSRKIVID